MAMLNNQRVRTLSEGTIDLEGSDYSPIMAAVWKKGASTPNGWWSWSFSQKIILIQRPLKKRACLMMFNMNGGWDWHRVPQSRTLRWIQVLAWNPGASVVDMFLCRRNAPSGSLRKVPPPTIWQEISAMNETDQLMDVDGNCSTQHWGLIDLGSRLAPRSHFCGVIRNLLQ